jgi:UDP:flavonoid glycosyltransferase YjiC (YdhE family)
MATSITIIGLGTRGDVQPLIPLAERLVQQQYDVTIATHDCFKQLIIDHNLKFCSAGGNPMEILESSAGQELLNSGSNPLLNVFRLVKLAKPIIIEIFQKVFWACSQTDIILGNDVALFLGHYLGKKLNVPHVQIHYYPLHATETMPNIYFNLNFLHNHKFIQKKIYRLTHFLYEKVFSFLMQSSISEACTTILNLPAVDSYSSALRQTPLTLCAFSPHIVPKPYDWNDRIHLTGYWFLNHEAEWKAPSQIEKFIKAGSAPIYIGLGSKPTENPKKMTDIIIEALCISGQRGILSTGWKGLSKNYEHENVLFTDYIPFDWLFPKMSMVVHAGGLGTTFCGIRAGIPNIVLPFFDDEPFWANRIHALGIGPKPIPFKEINAKKLAHAINEVISNPRIKKDASFFGKLIDAEKGVEKAVHILNEFIIFNIKNKISI